MSFAEVRGKTVLVHFFASWCEPCRSEIPAIQLFFAAYQAEGLSVVAIAVADVEPAVRKFLARTPVAFPVLLDRDRAVAKAWSIDSLPSTVLLDASLKPVAIALEDVDWDNPDAVEPVLLSLSVRGTKPLQ